MSFSIRIQPSMKHLFSTILAILISLIWIASATKSLKNFRPLRFTKDASTIVTIESLNAKLNEEKYPIFEFKSELDLLLSQQEEGNNDNISPLSLQNLLQRYLSGLRNHYYQEFCRRYDHHLTLPLNPLNNPQAIKGKMLKECEVAMKKSIPASMNATSFYEDYLAELKYDIDHYIDFNAVSDEHKSLDVFTQYEPPKPEVKGFRGFIGKVITKQRLKWIAGQALLLAINIAQAEIHKWWARREIDKKLAETPEFPLL